MCFRSFLDAYKILLESREMKAGPVDLSTGLGREAAREYTKTNASAERGIRKRAQITALFCTPGGNPMYTDNHLVMWLMENIWKTI